MPLLRKAKAILQSTTRPESPPAAAPTEGAFVTVGKAADVKPGELTAFKAGDQTVAVTQVAGAYYAVNDICAHAKCPLSDGELDGTTLTCICHGSRYDVTTGAVLRGPAQRAVRSYPVRVEGEDLQVQV